MKSNIVVLIVLSLCLSFTSCIKEKQVNTDDKINYVKTLIPDGVEGVGAYIVSRVPDGNNDGYPDFIALAWTFNGNLVVSRSLMKFDFSSIPEDAIIDSVKLSLYSYSSIGNYTHSTLGGSNLSYLKRITSEWDYIVVTWNNQPTTTNENQVVLAQSQYEIQNYLDIDVTELCVGMINNSATNFGFMIQLEVEEYYRRLIFASGANENESIRPRLEVYYSINE